MLNSRTTPTGLFHPRYASTISTTCVGSFMTASWKPGALSQSCLNACRNSLPTIRSRYGSSTHSVSQSRSPRVNVRRYTRVPREITTPASGRRMSAGAFSGVSSTPITYPRSSEGDLEPDGRITDRRFAGLNGKGLTIVSQVHRWEAICRHKRQAKDAGERHPFRESVEREKPFDRPKWQLYRAAVAVGHADDRG